MSYLEIKNYPRLFIPAFLFAINPPIGLWRQWDVILLYWTRSLAIADNLRDTSGDLFSRINCDKRTDWSTLCDSILHYA